VAPLPASAAEPVLAASASGLGAAALAYAVRKVAARIGYRQAASQVKQRAVAGSKQQGTCSSLDAVRQSGSSGPKRSTASQQDSVGTTGRRVKRQRRHRR
jgi:hypothetical protein